MKKFFEEFKKFITRGNVLDMAVGVIVGGAFTAIVNGLSNFILKPIINWLIALVLGKEGLTGAVTFLSKAYKLVDTGTVDAAGAAIMKSEIDLANSIYIDWGSFISAIINFLLIAFVLFSIVKLMNRIAEAQEKVAQGFKTEKEIMKKYRKQGLTKKQAREQYAKDVAAEKAAAEAAAAEEARIAAEKAAEEAKIAEEKATANTRLLEEIRDLLKKA
ncbi:MAG: large conductance mechanosensitive channel protein MscL [Clostridia bacterium]|nr:large conductance mechanosensitive channel protein MscL [Clostridia bacterium]